ncbi:hypothetical protein AJ79_09567 [Helicocarpus griseus UAMH5409]|uniref:Uncharacterized protein n=1 Tax=Helicocarpus griseus UAMH5409 TaxID=1447875 RepID=A0A2B7WJ33_9EURO|nr:hypothetical protein AJ79_09567 [Helicocarpus griseus UAMH5409]
MCSLTIKQEEEIVDNLAFLFYHYNPESYNMELFFWEIIKLDFSQILTQLRLGRKYPINKSHTVKLHRVLHQYSLTQIEPTELAAIQEKSNVFLNLYRQLKISSASQLCSEMWDVMKQLLKLSHKLAQSCSLATTLDQSSLDAVEKDTLLN